MWLKATLCSCIMVGRAKCYSALKLCTMSVTNQFFMNTHANVHVQSHQSHIVEFLKVEFTNKIILKCQKYVHCDKVMYKCYFLQCALLYFPEAFYCLFR